MIGDSYRFCLAPMMKQTDRHMRYFFRLISRHSLLYTEMLNANALVMGGRLDLLGHNAEEYPLACQLGGSDRESMAKATKLAAQAGYQEVNMNVGCPSSRVQNGDFGACLMKKPSVVADCLKAMQGRGVEITMKCRIGVDDFDNYAFLRDFMGEVVEASGIGRVIVHARIAKLAGLSPKENREVPPLKYDRVYRLLQDFPDLQIIINGGITDTETACEHLQHGVAGVMVGRAAMDKPFSFADIDKQIFGDTRQINRAWIFGEYLKYTEQQYGSANLFALLRPLSGLFYGIAGAKILRHKLATMATGTGFSMQAMYDLYASLSHNGTTSDSSEAFRV